MKKTISIILAIALVLSMVLSLAACGQTKQQGPVIRVGSKDFTENLIVAEIYALALEDAGYTVERKLNIAGSVVHTAITSGEIDLYPEYTGTGLLAILQLPMSSDPDEVYNTVKTAYDEQFQITWLDSTDVNDRNGLAIRTDVAQQYNIYTMSDLQREAKHIRVCSQGEFEYREDGIPGMTKVYGPFNFASINVYDNGIKYGCPSNSVCGAAPTCREACFLLCSVPESGNHWPFCRSLPCFQKSIHSCFFLLLF